MSSAPHDDAAPPTPAFQASDALDPALVEQLRTHAERYRHTPELLAFYTGLPASRAARLSRLWRIARRLQAGERRRATHTLRAELDGPGSHRRQGALVVPTFTRALLARATGDPRGGGNLYLESRPKGAQLRAFEWLRLRTPLIPFAYAAANRALLDRAPRGAEVTLIDIGIGQGGQTAALLRNPVTRATFKRLHVIGVEPDSQGDDDALGALQLAEANVRAAAQEADLPVSFQAVGKRAEALTPQDLHQAGARGLLMANMGFALHHVPFSGAGRDRGGILRMLRELGVQVLTLVEPDSDHCTDDLPDRLLYAYRHYATVARSLVEVLGPADAHLVWEQFFAPEVHNVIASDGAARTERHEETGRWIERLREAGWRPDNATRLTPAAAPDGFDVRSGPNYCSLVFDDVSLLSVMCAQP